MTLNVITSKLLRRRVRLHIEVVIHFFSIPVTCCRDWKGLDSQVAKLAASHASAECTAAAAAAAAAAACIAERQEHRLMCVALSSLRKDNPERKSEWVCGWGEPVAVQIV